MDGITAKSGRLELRLGSKLSSELQQLTTLKEITKAEVIKRALKFYHRVVLASSKGAKVLLEEDGVQKEVVDL